MCGSTFVQSCSDAVQIDTEFLEQNAMFLPYGVTNVFFRANFHRHVQKFSFSYEHINKMVMVVGMLKLEYI